MGVVVTAGAAVFPRDVAERPANLSVAAITRRNSVVQSRDGRKSPASAFAKAPADRKERGKPDTTRYP